MAFPDLGDDQRRMITIFLVTDGGSCWYCFRIWATVYRSRWSLTEFKEQARSKQEHNQTNTKQIKDTHKAKTQAVNDDISKYKHWLVKQVVDAIEARIENERITNKHT